MDLHISSFWAGVAATLLVIATLCILVPLCVLVFMDANPFVDVWHWAANRPFCQCITCHRAIRRWQTPVAVQLQWINPNGTTGKQNTQRHRRCPTHPHDVYIDA